LTCVKADVNRSSFFTAILALKIASHFSAIAPGRFLFHPGSISRNFLFGRIFGENLLSTLI